MVDVVSFFDFTSIFFYNKTIQEMTTEVMMFILVTAVAIIGYFLKIVHADVRKNTEEQGKLKGKIELVEQEARLKYQAIQEQTQLEIKNLAKNVGDLADTVRQLISK
jgi:Na+/citrate or Na+/malate symporter